MSDLNFMDINDDCISTIFEYLQMKDVISMSVQCVRLRNLALDHIRRNCGNESLTIARRLKGVKYEFGFVKPRNGLMRHFAKFIRNIRIIGPNVLQEMSPLDPQLFFYLLSTECCEHLMSLKLNISGVIREEHGKMIENQLKHIEKLSLKNLSIQGDLYDVLLKYCQNLKHLEISIDGDNSKSWLKQNYPKLESIRIGGWIDYFEEHGKTFFERHPKITVICADLGSIKTIFDIANTCKIERLTLMLCENFARNIEFLPVSVKKNHIKHLEMIINPDTSSDDVSHMRHFMTTIKELQKVQQNLRIKLYKTFEDFEVIGESLSFLDLGIVFDPTINIFNELSQKLINIEELCMDLGSDYLSFHEFTLNFIENCPKLRKILIENANSETFNFENTNLLELNRIRETNQDACSITIAIEYWGADQVLEIPRLEHPENGSKVHLNFRHRHAEWISSKLDVGCDHFDCAEDECQYKF